MTVASDPLATLRERVEQQEQELESAVRELAAVAKKTVMPAHWIREKPLVCLTGALAIGVWLGSRRQSWRRRAWR